MLTARITVFFLQFLLLTVFIQAQSVRPTVTSADLKLEQNESVNSSQINVIPGQSDIQRNELLMFTTNGADPSTPEAVMLLTLRSLTHRIAHEAASLYGHLNVLEGNVFEISSPSIPADLAAYRHSLREKFLSLTKDVVDAADKLDSQVLIAYETLQKRNQSQSKPGTPTSSPSVFRFQSRPLRLTRLKQIPKDSSTASNISTPTTPVSNGGSPGTSVASSVILNQTDTETEKAVDKLIQQLVNKTRVAEEEQKRRSDTASQTDEWHLSNNPPPAAASTTTSVESKSNHRRLQRFGGIMGRGQGLNGGALPGRFYMDRSAARSAYFRARGNYGEYRPTGGMSFGRVNIGPGSWGPGSRFGIPRMVRTDGRYEPYRNPYINNDIAGI